MKRAVFGNFGVENLGDDLILQGFLQQHQDDQVMVFCGNPKAVTTTGVLSVHSFFPAGLRSWLKFFSSSEYRRQIKESWDALRSVDHISIGGGGILVDKHWKAVLMWWMQLRKIKKSGTPFSFIANSFELTKWWSKALLVPYLKRAESVTVRDSASLRFAKQQGIIGEQVLDLAYSAELPKKDATTNRILSLALCRWGMGNAQKHALQSFVKKAQEQGWDVQGLVFQSIGDNDRKVYKELDLDMAIIEGVDQVLEALSKTTFLVGMRLHSLILADRFDIPSIALAYQQKVENFMQDKQHSEFCIPIQNLDEQNLQELFGKAFAADK